MTLTLYAFESPLVDAVLVAAVSVVLVKMAIILVKAFTL